MKVFKCDKCGKEFSSKEALEMHSASKHMSASKRKNFTNKQIAQVKIIAALCVALVAIVGASDFVMTNAVNCSSSPVSRILVTSGTSLAESIYPVLTINILGQDYAIPAGIGVKQSGNNPIYTQDSSGTLHVESPCQRNFVLGDFFGLWNQTFNSSCVLSHCVDSNHTLTMFVDGSKSNQFENLSLRDKQNITIYYKVK